VHREICGAAGVYFQRFSPQELASRIAEVVEAPELAAELSRAGTDRARAFSWTRHVDELFALASSLVAKK
jgi:glycosyltransferase involved in cell wall biosynthesis